MGMKCYLIVVSICISLMANNIEHLSLHLLAICQPYFKCVSVVTLCSTINLYDKYQYYQPSLSHAKFRLLVANFLLRQ